MAELSLEPQSIDGVAYVERSGSHGVPVVMLHGIGSHAASFAPVMAQLPADRRLIAWNAPGYDQSNPLPMDWPRASDYAQVLADLVDALELDRFMLIGHSLGALMAASFAVQHPGRIARLVLAAPALGHGVDHGAALSAQAQARIDQLNEMGPHAFAEVRAARLVHAPHDHPDIVATVREGMSRVRMPGYGQAVRMLASGRLLEDAAQLCVPTDVITGANDLITPPDGARKAHATLNAQWRGELVEVAGVGHAITQQAPEAVAALLVGEHVAA